EVPGRHENMAAFQLHEIGVVIGPCRQALRGFVHNDAQFRLFGFLHGSPQPYSTPAPRTVTTAPFCSASTALSTSWRVVLFKRSENSSVLIGRTATIKSRSIASATSSFDCAALILRPNKWRLASAISASVGGSDFSLAISAFTSSRKTSTLSGSTPAVSVTKPAPDK